MQICSPGHRIKGSNTVSCVGPCTHREHTWQSQTWTGERQNNGPACSVTKWGSLQRRGCVCVGVRLCVCVGGVGMCKRVHNHFSPGIHQSNTRSHSLLCNNLLLSSSLPVKRHQHFFALASPASSPLWFCPLSSVDEWIKRGIDREMNGWWMNVGCLDRERQTQSNGTLGRGVDWRTCWWKLKKDVTRERF